MRHRPPRLPRDRGLPSLPHSQWFRVLASTWFAPLPAPTHSSTANSTPSFFQTPLPPSPTISPRPHTRRPHSPAHPTARAPPRSSPPARSLRLHPLHPPHAP